MSMTNDLLSRNLFRNESYTRFLTVGENALVLIIAQYQNIPNDSFLLNVQSVVALVTTCTSFTAVVEPNDDLLMSRSVSHFILLCLI